MSTGWLLVAGGYPLALLLTLALEVPVYVAALRTLGETSTVRCLLLSCAVNLVSHPLLWTLAAGRPGLGWLLGLEAAVVLSETAMVWLVVRRMVGWVLLAALGANAWSLAVGLVALPLMVEAVETGLR